MEGRESVLHRESFNPQIEILEGEELIIELLSQLKTLRSRVEELELENTRLSSQISNCRCRKVEESPECSALSGDISVEDIVQSTAGVGVGAVSSQEDSREEKGIYTRGKDGTRIVDGNKKKKSKEETIGEKNPTSQERERVTVCS